MKFLFISSHEEEEDGWNNKLIELLANHLKVNKHEVKIVDLYGIKFNPVGGPHDFKKLWNKESFDYQLEQKKAVSNDNFVKEVQDQLNNAKWCDVMLFFYPLTGLSFNSMMKGYVDRIYAYYFAYGGTNSLGKKAMFIPNCKVEKNAKKVKKLMTCQNMSQNFSGNVVLNPFLIFEESKTSINELIKHVDGQFSFFNKVAQKLSFPRIKAFANVIFG